MIQKDNAIILSIIKYKDKNLIIRAFTEKNGIKSFITTLSSARKKGSSNNNYQIFSILEVVYQTNAKSGLHRIKESKNIHLLIDIRVNVYKSAITFLLAEIFNKSIQEEEKNVNLYTFLESQILLLNNCIGSFTNFHLYSISQLTKQIGLCPVNKGRFLYFNINEGEFTTAIPTNSYYLETAEASLFQKLLDLPWEETRKIPMTGESRTAFLLQLLKYYKYHLPGFKRPKSLDVLIETFNM